jgi:hypothetical protein
LYYFCIENERFFLDLLDLIWAKILKVATAIWIRDSLQLKLEEFSSPSLRLSLSQKKSLFREEKRVWASGGERTFPHSIIWSFRK